MESLSIMRDLSLIWLLSLALLASLPFVVIFFYAIRGMKRLRQLTKQYMPVAQDYARLAADKTEEVSVKVADPFISIKAKKAQADGITQAVFSRRKDS
jgi:hypothetical protein